MTKDNKSRVNKAHVTRKQTFCGATHGAQWWLCGGVMMVVVWWTDDDGGVVMVVW